MSENSNDAGSFGTELGKLVGGQLDAGTNPYLLAGILRAAADRAEVYGTTAIADDIAGDSRTAKSDFRITEVLE